MQANYIWWVPLLPFLGFLINGTLGRKLPRPAVAAIALLFTAIPAALVAWLWSTMLSTNLESITTTLGPWIQVSGFHVDFAFTVDHLTLIMLAIITGVGFLIHLYSTGYMAHEEGYWRFFAYLNLFMFFMLVLVLSSNFLLLFVGWEGVGLASYLLIGFYFKKKAASDAGKKAFVVNRIGDFGFLLAMFLIIAHFGGLSFNSVFTQVLNQPELHGGYITAIALLLVVGAAGKSAQIPLYVWLPDAMEGPTPVSALIHAATMVTAGIYMVARSHVLFDRSPFALGVVAILGALTAIFAASIGMVQNDIKRVLAYSTVSQLGYMFLGCGVAAYSAAVFHLMTHAFFKALLFLAAGSVIHALSGEQDMRNMGGLRKRIPITFWTMSAGVFAIAGFPPLAAFFSKDEILYRAFISDNPLAKLLWAVGLLTALMTSFYMFRLWYKTFFGAERFNEHHLTHAAAGTHAHEAEHDNAQAAHAHGVHESPWSMTLPLGILAILSVIGGWVGIPAALGGSNHFEHFLDPVFLSGAEPAITAATSYGLELVLAFFSVLAAVLGLFLADLYFRRKPGTLGARAANSRVLYPALLNKYWIDEIYNGLIVVPLVTFTRFFFYGLIDRGIVNGSAKAAAYIATGLATVTRRMQSGNIRSYAGWLAAGAAVVILIMTYGLVAHGAMLPIR